MKVNRILILIVVFFVMAIITKNPEYPPVENFAIAYGTDKIKFHISEDVSCSRVANNELVENIEIPACTLATIANKYLGDKSFTLVIFNCD